VPLNSHRTLTVSELFPPVGAPIYLNHLRHHGDMFLHDHEFIEIGMIGSGRGLHRTVHGIEPVSAGDVVLVLPGQWHAWEKSVDLWIYNIDFSTSLLAHELSWVASDPLLAPLLPHRRKTALGPDQDIAVGRLDESVMALVAAQCERMMTLAESGDHLRTRAEMIGHLCVALGLIARHLPKRHVAIDRVDDGVRDLIQAMEERLDHTWGLDELARRLDVTPAYLVRRFHRVAGLAPMTWLTRRRTEAAAVLLVTTDAPVADIAKQVGWSDANYFARRFRSVFGINPSAYRQQVPRKSA
jgi:AraC family transcriptional regulator, L-rhamnose operon transcriptional activator RhaR